jgi:hypothetical protein
MTYSRHTIFKWLAVILRLAIIAVMVALACSGCSISKAKSSRSIDSTATHKVDSGGVSKSNSTSKQANEWFRETFYFGRDTTINNYYTQPAGPAMIIREGGQSSTENNHSTYDSGWRKVADSLALALEESKKQKQEQALNGWQIAGLIVGGALILTVLSKFIKFHNPLKKEVKNVT